MAQFTALFTILVLAVCSDAMPKRHQGIHLEPPRAFPPKGRLTYDVIPRNYKIDLTATNDNIVNGNFSGSVQITLNVKANISAITIHAKEIIILGDVTLTQDENSMVLTPSAPDEDDLVHLTSETFILPSNKPYILTINYNGKLSQTDLEGFYHSTYMGTDAKLHHLATTQFAEMGARRAFPCFDEPAFKATFDISITYSEAYNALSNTEIVRTDPPKDGTKKTTFKTTPFMSTYLVAFIVSEFKCEAGVATTDGITPEVCARISTETTMAVAKDTAPKALNEMASFTKLNYKDLGNAKMSLAAIPDFALGAMENWGMVTFREADLLIDPDESSDYYKQKVVSVVTHEFSHQWFGDRVTFDWWSNIFLNEGFATYFEYLGTANIDTAAKWELPKQFVIEQLQPVFVSDSVDTSLPLSYQTDDPETISSRFDEISYNKGGSILRMVHHLLGVDNFKKGLTDYLRLSPIGTPTHLWDSLNKYGTELPATLLEIMDSWTYKAGYPQLTLTLNEEGDKITVTQERFLISGEDKEKTNWYVPITYTTDKSIDFEDTATKAWLVPGKELILPLNGAKWMILNNQQVGYYRVNYEDKLLENILEVLTADRTKIDEISRSQIVDDQLNFARAGLKDYGTVLGFFPVFLKNEDSYYVWSSAFSGFDYLLKRTSSAEIKTALNKYILDQMVALLKADDSKDHISILRGAMAKGWACKLGQEACIADAKKQFEDFQTDPVKKRIDPNLRSYVYCQGLRNSDNATGAYNFLYNQYTSSNLATEKVTILKALGCVSDSKLRTQYLLSALSDDVRIQDVTYVFSSVYSYGPEGVDDVITFITQKYQLFDQHFGTTSTLNSLIYSVADVFTTQAQIDRLDTFSKTTSLASIKAAAEGGVKNAKVNLAKITELEKSLTTYFDLGDSSSAVVNGYSVISLGFILVAYLMFNF